MRIVFYQPILIGGAPEINPGESLLQHTVGETARAATTPATQSAGPGRTVTWDSEGVKLYSAQIVRGARRRAAGPIQLTGQPLRGI